MTDKPVIPRPPAPPALPVIPRHPAWSLARRNRHVTVPVLVPFAFAAAGMLAGLFPAARPELIVATVICTGTVAAAGPRKWDRRIERWYAALTVAGFGSWLTVTAWTGLTVPVVAALLVLSAAWGLPWWRHKRPRRDGRRAERARWNTWWQHHCVAWDLPGTAVTGVTTRGTTVTLQVSLWAGRQTWRDVAKVSHLIESALRGEVGVGMVRVAAVKTHPARAHVHVKGSDPLAVPLAWDASLNPVSVRDPVVIGRTESGTWVRACLLSNWFIGGRSRAGKSNEASLFFAAITGCEDARLWLIDRKGGRAAKPWLPAADWVATTIEEARLMLGCADAEIEARGTSADDSKEQLDPVPEVPALFIVVDEANKVTSMTNGDPGCAARLASIASTGMGLAVYVIVLTQYGALEESVSTEQTRGNLLNRLLFAVSDPAHGRFFIPEYASLNPAVLEHPGSFYAKLGPEAIPEPLRAPEMSHELVRSIAARNGAMPRPRLRLHAQDWQGVYDTRWARLAEPFRSVAAARIEADGLGDPQVPPLREAPASPAPGGFDVTAALARIEADGAHLPDDIDAADLSLPSGRQLSGVVSLGKTRFARALQQAPEDGVSPASLATATGLSRSWIHAQLRGLTAAGKVIRTGRGSYRAADGVIISECLDKTREDAERLLTGAGR